MWFIDILQKVHMKVAVPSAWFCFHWRWQFGVAPMKSVKLPGVRWDQNKEFTVVEQIYIAMMDYIFMDYDTASIKKKY